MAASKVHPSITFSFSFSLAGCGLNVQLLSCLAQAMPASSCRGGCRPPPLTISFHFLFNALCTGHIQWGQAMPLVNYGDVNMIVGVAWTQTLLAALAHKRRSYDHYYKELLPQLFFDGTSASAASLLLLQPCFCCTSAYTTPLLLLHLLSCHHLF